MFEGIRELLDATRRLALARDRSPSCPRHPRARSLLATNAWPSRLGRDKKAAASGCIQGRLASHSAEMTDGAANRGQTDPRAGVDWLTGTSLLWR